MDWCLKVLLSSLILLAVLSCYHQVRQNDPEDEISDRSKRSAVLSDEDVQRQRDQQRRSEEYYAAAASAAGPFSNHWDNQQQPPSKGGQNTYRSSSSSPARRDEPFGPVRVTDTEVNPPPVKSGGSESGYTYRRYNMTVSHGTRTSSSSSGSSGVSNPSPGIGFGKVHNPVLWHNKTWHWSTNRTRDYDPDLDGTTVAPDEEDAIPGPLIEPYDIHLPWERASCDDKSCHPETGDLLIGREHLLTASSTCGTHGQERYCVISGVTQRKKCFVCDANPIFKEDKYKYHGIENIVQTQNAKRFQKWWQAENGVEKVTIQLDLGAEFQFTHLMIRYQTFRPAAMILERSKDFGATWEVYQYFAHDCAQVFPHVRAGQRKRLNDVTCISEYSQTDLASRGEVIFRVLPNSLSVSPEPYSPEVQNLLKLTNLRLNMTKLHTLGDNLLDERAEIKEKYYYAIDKMIVRGKCSCYGHADKCVPDDPNSISNVPNMVYGKCLCQHHTTGNNCELCEDLYNDVRWDAAFGDDKHECKKCECHNHATKCEFDEAVFEASGRKSGGKCVQCMHNTQGIHCESCKDFFYRDTSKSLDDPNGCVACDCDPKGSLDDGLCDDEDEETGQSVAGKCHCKQNVEGRRCDKCRPGYWNFREENGLGCEPCSCNQLGTVGNLGCNVNTGECVCKRNVIGRDCNECAAQFYGLGADTDGCKQCDCDDGGSYDNNCDIVSGQCKCRPNVTGRRCDTPENAHFAPMIDFLRYEGELAKGSPDTNVIEREPYAGAGNAMSWTGTGFVHVSDKSTLEFDITDVPVTLEYDFFIRYEPQNRGIKPDQARVILERLSGPPEQSGPCRDAYGSDQKTATLNYVERIVSASPGSFCLERGKPYRFKIVIDSLPDPSREGNPSTLIDSFSLVPRPEKIPFFQGSPANEYKKQDFENYQCLSYVLSSHRRAVPDICRKYLNSIGLFEFNGARDCQCDPTGSESAICETLGGQCKCKTNVISRTCHRCAPGHYGFGPDGCKPCDCHHIGSLDNFCDLNTGQCHCRNNTYGRKCDECQPGFWNYPACQRCNCNGHSAVCDSKTGVCINCQDHTSGASCDVCEHGFYGNPLIGVDITCRPCPCPGVPGSGVSHADTCDLDPRTQNPICRCLPGYTGERCDRCDNNFWGSPTTVGGSCNQCQCNGNTDLVQPGNCDASTGECLKCLYNTGGPSCEVCDNGYFGDATKQQCARCVCNALGTNSSSSAICDPHSGQCPCLPNIVGKECDECALNHYNLASKKGCEACECDSTGSHSLKCNLIDGQCHCRPGHGGRRCNECQANHWGDPRTKCFPCDCSMSGSSSAQCDRSNGSCICIKGIAGAKCDKCARGYLGLAPHCTGCGECFENWDVTIQALKQRTDELISNARKIKTTGAVGAYREEFTRIEGNLEEIERIIAGANVTQADVLKIEEMINALRNDLNKIQEQLLTLSNRMDETTGRTTDENLSLAHLKNAAKSLETATQNMKENMTALQEANVEGAFNLTKDAQKRSSNARIKVESTVSIVGASANKRSNTEELLARYSSQYNQSFTSNEEGLAGLSRRIKGLEDKVPDINQLVCDGRANVNECDSLCGGAGCGKCGGISCKGAAPLAASALELANQSKEKLKDKQEKAKKELDGALSAKSKSDEALRQAILAYEKSLAARNTSQDTTMLLQQLLDEIDKFFAAEASKPAEIRTIAEQCVNMRMSLTPEQILNLAKQINDTMAGITNIEAILVATASDLQLANDLKRRADTARAKAEDILGTAKQVLEALEKAREAQEKAQEAIRKAKKDIGGANDDLIQITGESEAASNLSLKAQEAIGQLQDRLDELKKKFTQNELDVKKAGLEADIASNLSKEAAKRAGDLETQYERAKLALEQKAKDSGANKQRAEQLRERAKALAEAANSKYKELQGLEDDFDDNERRLINYQKIIDDLNNQMKDHLKDIDAKSQYHRSCTP